MFTVFIKPRLSDYDTYSLYLRGESLEIEYNHSSKLKQMNIDTVEITDPCVDTCFEQLCASMNMTDNAASTAHD